MRRLLSLWIFDWRKLLAYSHRWLGIAGCVLFVAWFISGVVMMYARMPGLAEEERLARAPALDLSTVHVSPADAAEKAGIKPGEVQVGMLQGRPVYRFGGREQTIVFADTGDVFEGIGHRDEALQIARRYAPGHTGTLRYAAYVTEPDQWTIQSRNRMPMHRFDLDDAEDTHLYVSEVTGDVVLRTTRAERFWGYLGPVFHWVYFTPLRKNGPLWTQFVIWSSLIGCVMCVTGIVWGLWRYSPRSSYRLKRVPSISPYAGWMKWHHIAGLIFGVVTLTWTYSGLLSMGPFNWFRSPPASRAEREASTGGPLKVQLLSIDSMRAAYEAIAPAFRPKELETMQFRGEPHWVAYEAPSQEQAVIWMHSGLLPRSPRPEMEHRYVSAVHPDRGAITTFGREAMTEIAQAAMPGVAVQDAVWLRRLRRLLLRLEPLTAAAGAARPLRRRKRDVALPRSGTRRHRPAVGQGQPAAALAVPGIPQPRLPVPLLPASALGHRGHCPEHRRHGAEPHDDAAGVAASEAARPVAHGVPAVETSLLGYAVASRPGRGHMLVLHEDLKGDIRMLADHIASAWQRRDGPPRPS